jgi:cytochrome c peroxidase
MRSAHFNPSLFRAFRFPVAAIALLWPSAGSAPPASAQDARNAAASETRAWAQGAIDHAQQMRVHKDRDQSSQPTPPIIPKLGIDGDPGGRVGTFQPGVATITANNAFFQNLGTNGRTCFTCHQPQTGWTISAADVRARFAASAGTDPIFRLVDGATCPTDDVSTLHAKRRAYKLVMDKGLIRIGLPMPSAPNLEFSVAAVDDPYGCTTNPATGLTSPTTGIVSMYRRPLPSTNLGFLTAIMWDGREPSLAQQSIDATLIHAQAAAAPTADQQKQIVDFETGIFTAQIFDDEAGSLHARGATGGPVALSLHLSKFFVGVNDPVGLNPTGLPFDPKIFDLYKPWLGLKSDGEEAQRRLSVAHGEEVFNTTKINITGVAGLNDVLNLPSIAGFCGTCHDTPNVGNHSVKAPLNIGVANAGADSPPALDISGLPAFTLQCHQGPLAGQTFVVTDPGRALISGKCADIGKVKGPILRGLAARAPYFHNGSAATLLDAVNFYDQRFGIGFTERQKQDLVNFLNTL